MLKNIQITDYKINDIKRGKLKNRSLVRTVQNAIEFTNPMS